MLKIKPAGINHTPTGYGIVSDRAGGVKSLYNLLAQSADRPQTAYVMKTGAKTLCLLGLLGVGFFWATDPRYGFGTRLDGKDQTNLIDAIHDAKPGTIAGLAGSLMVLVIGSALVLKRD
jgi:hypothetical protein